MARPLRFPSPATELKAGRTYHVTNRGVDRCTLFHNDVDRLIFLSLVADACGRTGVVCHAFCLMTNHFHLVVEDPRGVLSQFMHGVESLYARFFNDTRPGRRTGPLFQSRFHSDEIDSRAYFDAACAYVANNPLRAEPRLTERPDEYTWSSAAFALGGESLTAARFCAGLLDRCGGVEGLLAVFRPAGRSKTEDLRRRRIEAFAAGAWIERHHVLDGRSAALYREVLFSRLGTLSPFAKGREEGHVTDGDERTEDGEALSPAGLFALPSRPKPFGGLALEKTRAEIEERCSQMAPTPSKATLVYLLMRFCNTTATAIGRALELAPEAVVGMIEQVRASRVECDGWARALWRVEWALQWRLLAAPFRC